MLTVRVIVRDCGIPGYLVKEVNFAFAVTCTITTQWPAVHVPAVPPIQEDAAMILLLFTLGFVLVCIPV